MSRRVIFPDPDIWTTPKEKTMAINNTADYRRATALIRHHAVGDQEGITAILVEGEAEDRGTQLLVALLGIFAFIQPLLRTDTARTAMRQCIDLTADADDQPYWVRAAASAIAAYADDDKQRLGDAIDSVLAEGRGAGVLFQGVSDIWFNLMPELRAPAGLHALTRWATGLAAVEGEEEQQ
jgi:hypothetical protein